MSIAYISNMILSSLGHRYSIVSLNTFYSLQVCTAPQTLTPQTTTRSVMFRGKDTRAPTPKTLG